MTIAPWETFIWYLWLLPVRSAESYSWLQHTWTATPSVRFSPGRLDWFHLKFGCYHPEQTKSIWDSWAVREVSPKAACARYLRWNWKLECLNRWTDWLLFGRYTQKFDGTFIGCSCAGAATSIPVRYWRWVKGRGYPYFSGFWVLEISLCLSCFWERQVVYPDDDGTISCRKLILNSCRVNWVWAQYHRGIGKLRSFPGKLKPGLALHDAQLDYLAHFVTGYQFPNFSNPGLSEFAVVYDW